MTASLFTRLNPVAKVWVAEGLRFVVQRPCDKKTFRVAPRDARHEELPRHFRSFEAACKAAVAASKEG